MKPHLLLKTLLTLALVTLTAVVGLAADITVDPPQSGLAPGTINIKGTWKVDKGENGMSIYLSAFPAGGGKGNMVQAAKGGETYSGTINNLQPGAAYDVLVTFQYDDKNSNRKAVFSKIYTNIKAQEEKKDNNPGDN